MDESCWMSWSNIQPYQTSLNICQTCVWENLLEQVTKQRQNEETKSPKSLLYWFSLLRLDKLLMSWKILLRMFSSPGNKLESSQAFSCSYHDQSTVHRCPVNNRLDGYGTSVQGDPAPMVCLINKINNCSGSLIVIIATSRIYPAIAEASGYLELQWTIATRYDIYKNTIRSLQSDLLIHATKEDLPRTYINSIKVLDWRTDGAYTAECGSLFYTGIFQGKHECFMH